MPYISPQGFSNYNALIANLEKRYSRGLSLVASYTWSRALGVAPPLNAGINGVPVVNVLDLGRHYGPLEFDIQHRGIFSYVYDLPFGKGRSFLGQASGLANHLIGGWQFGGITTFQGGFPITPVLTVSLGRTFTNSRPNAVGDPAQSARQPHDWINRSAFAIPSSAEVAAGNYFGNTGTGSVRSPGLVNFDFSILKNITLREELRLQFRTEVFNLTNTPYFGLPGAVNTNYGSAPFGRVTAAGDPRVLQFGLKLIF
jgi:hypothetical protein